MTVLGEIAAFGVGVFLMIAMISALYGIIDFWYMIGRTWPRVVRGILGWGIAIAAAVWLLAPPYRTAYVAGLMAYLVFYIGCFPLFRIFMWSIRRRL